MPHSVSNGLTYTGKYCNCNLIFTHKKGSNPFVMIFKLLHWWFKLIILLYHNFYSFSTVVNSDCDSHYHSCQSFSIFFWSDEVSVFQIYQNTKKCIWLASLDIWRNSVIEERNERSFIYAITDFSSREKNGKYEKIGKYVKIIS